jgi:hypothetical protein
LTTHGRPIGGNGVAVFVERVDEAIGDVGSLQRFGGEAADAFAIHRQARGARGRDHAQAAVGLRPSSISTSVGV